MPEISKYSRIEKNIRHGHPSTLHIWFARRPLCSSRAVTFASLVDLPEEDSERDKLLTLIKSFLPWENYKDFYSKPLIAARSIIEKEWLEAPKVLDPFAGGGSLPLEALRLGCRVYANDLNPVATLILRATLEWPHKFHKFSKDTSLKQKVEELAYKIHSEVKKELGNFYPDDSDGWIPVGYIWLRTIPCSNPSCEAIIPLIKHYWLAKKKNKKIAFKLVVNHEMKSYNFDIVEGKAINFDPSRGTINRGNALCPFCGHITPIKHIRQSALEGRMGERLAIVILRHPKIRGKKYRVATDIDKKTFQQASNYLTRLLSDETMVSYLPDEDIPPPGSLGINLQAYGLKKWKDLFNDRQQLAILTLIKSIKSHYFELKNEYKNIDQGEEFVRAVMSYLTLILGRLIDKNAKLVVYNVYGEKIEHVFGRNALPITWDYVELNIFSGGNGDWFAQTRWVLKFLEANCWESKYPVVVTQQSATDLPYTNSFFDAIITDPPYYDYIPYSDLSDFFYVWFKRILGTNQQLLPDLFSYRLSPKSEEIIHDKKRHSNSKVFFEKQLTLAFKEMSRVLKPEGIAIIIYAHRNDDGWETLLNALIEAKFVVTASYPITTERQTRLRARASASLSSSIFIVCRKRALKPPVHIKSIEKQIDNRIIHKLSSLEIDQLLGGDFIISAIIPAFEIYSQFEKIIKSSKEVYTVKDLLVFVRKVSTRYIISKVLDQSSLGSIDGPSQLFLLFRWLYGKKINDSKLAETLAESCNVNLEQLWEENSFIRKKGSSIQLLNSYERRNINNDSLLINKMHKVLLLWKQTNQERLRAYLQQTSLLEEPLFWRYCQAVAETYPAGNKEKRNLEGLLINKNFIL